MQSINEQLTAIVKKYKTYSSRLAQVRKQENADELITELLSKGFLYYSGQESYVERREIKHDQETQKKRRRELDDEMRIYVKATVFDWRMKAIGKNLGACTRSDLNTEIVREQAIAAGHTRNILFYEEVASNLHDDKMPVDSLPLPLVEEIRDRIYNKYNKPSKEEDIHAPI
jgi:hypothetical protein